MNITRSARTTSNRDYWFDNAKAFLILTVFWGHICECLIRAVPFEGGTPLWLESFFKFIYTFHMPVFMMISGRFAKGRIDRNDWLSAVNKLIVPYIIIQLCMVLFSALVGYSKLSLTAFLSPGYGLWYILVLGIYQIITPLFNKIIHNKWWLFALSLVLMLALTYLPFSLPAPFQRIVNFYPFFLFGYMTSSYSFSFCKKPVFRALSIFMLIGLLLLITKDSVLEIALLSGKRVYFQYKELMGLSRIEVLLITVVRYAAGFLCFPLIMGISGTKKNVFTKMGTNSTYIYILHLFIIVALTALGKRYGILDFCKNEVFALLMLVGAVPLSLLLVSKPVRRVTAPLVAPKISVKKIFPKK